MQEELIERHHAAASCTETFHQELDVEFDVTFWVKCDCKVTDVKCEREKDDDKRHR